MSENLKSTYPASCVDYRESEKAEKAYESVLKWANDLKFKIFDVWFKLTNIYEKRAITPFKHINFNV